MIMHKLRGATAAAVPLAFVALGAASIWDAQRIGRSFRRTAGYDLLGPGGYLYFVGGLLLVCGVCLAVSAYWRRRHADRREATAAPGGHATAFALTLALLAYAMLLPALGYLLATAAFFCAAFRLIGVRSHAENAVATLCATAGVYVIFVLLGDLPLPRGPLFGL